MDSTTHHSIGDLARRTGLTIKTIRFYSDSGIVPPTARNRAGHRVYDSAALARLEYVRTLRDLGLGLETIRKILDRECSLPAVVAAHADAVALQIRVLQVRRAVLLAVAERGSTPDAMLSVPALARMSARERQALVCGFLEDVFGDADREPAATGIMRTLTPELPDDAGPEQIEAWVELAELARHAGLRETLRHLAEHLALDRARHGTGPHRDTAATIRDIVDPMLAARVDPSSPDADRAVDDIAAHFAWVLALPDGPGVRGRLLNWLDAAGDERRARYLELLSVVNDWPEPDTLAPVVDWARRAVAARLTPTCDHSGETRTPTPASLANRPDR